ncbi:MAG: branched-chain amino acid ABC transporter permease [Acidimicrobiia bacterium]
MRSHRLDGGGRGDDPAVGTPERCYYFLLGIAGVAISAMWILMRSPFGATLKAIRENRERAGFLGIRVKRYELAAFTLGGAFAGVAGAMFAIQDQGAFPNLLLWTKSAEPIFITLIGGQFVFLGPSLGALIFIPLEYWVTRTFAYWGAVLGVILLLIILFLPGGVGDALRRLFNRDGAPPEASDPGLEDVGNLEVTGEHQ